MSFHLHPLSLLLLSFIILLLSSSRSSGLSSFPYLLGFSFRFHFLLILKFLSSLLSYTRFPRDFPLLTTFPSSLFISLFFPFSSLCLFPFLLLSTSSSFLSSLNCLSCPSSFFRSSIRYLFSSFSLFSFLFRLVYPSSTSSLSFILPRLFTLPPHLFLPPLPPFTQLPQHPLYPTLYAISSPPSLFHLFPPFFLSSAFTLGLLSSPRFTGHTARSFGLL